VGYPDIAEITLINPGDILFLYTDGVYDAAFPSSQRRGGCAVNEKPRSCLIPRQTGWSGRSFFAGLTTPSAPFKGGFATFVLCRVHPSSARRGMLLIFKLTHYRNF
jgi:hypothetical protein